MSQKIIAISLMCGLFWSGCNFFKSEKPSNKNTQQIKSVQIQLFPAFNNSSYILIDKTAKTMHFKVDTTNKFRGLIPNEFIISLDSFEKNTLIDSFS
jgi:hypothetical protein